MLPQLLDWRSVAATIEGQLGSAVKLNGTIDVFGLGLLERAAGPLPRANEYAAEIGEEAKPRVLALYAASGRALKAVYAGDTAKAVAEIEAVLAPAA